MSNSNSGSEGENTTQLMTRLHLRTSISRHPRKASARPTSYSSSNSSASSAPASERNNAPTSTTMDNVNSIPHSAASLDAGAFFDAIAEETGSPPPMGNSGSVVGVMPNTHYVLDSNLSIVAITGFGEENRQMASRTRANERPRFSSFLTASAFQVLSPLLDLVKSSRKPVCFSWCCNGSSADLFTIITPFSGTDDSVLELALGAKHDWIVIRTFGFRENLYEDEFETITRMIDANKDKLITICSFCSKAEVRAPPVPHSPSSGPSPDAPIIPAGEVQHVVCDSCQQDFARIVATGAEQQMLDLRDTPASVPAPLPSLSAEFKGLLSIPRLHSVNDISSVLIIDDEAMNRKIVERTLKRVLTDMEFVVTFADSGVSALDRCSTTHYDLIFSDLMMPEMCGQEFIRKVQPYFESRSNPRPVVIVVSSSPMSEITEALDAGADEYIPKPVTPQLMAAVLKRAFAMRNR